MTVTEKLWTPLGMPIALLCCMLFIKLVLNYLDKPSSQTVMNLKKSHSLNNNSNNNNNDDDDASGAVKNNQNKKDGNANDDDDIVANKIHVFQDRFPQVGWNILLIVYAQLISTFFQLVDCRYINKDIGSVMFWAGSVSCYTTQQYIAFACLSLCFLFPIFMLWKLCRAYRELDYKVKDYEDSKVKFTCWDKFVMKFVDCDCFYRYEYCRLHRWGLVPKYLIKRRRRTESRIRSQSTHSQHQLQRDLVVGGGMTISSRPSARNLSTKSTRLLKSQISPNELFIKRRLELRLQKERESSRLRVEFSSLTMSYRAGRERERGKGGERIFLFFFSFLLILSRSSSRASFILPSFFSIIFFFLYANKNKREKKRMLVL